MDSEEITDMQSQQSSAHNHDRYNKLAHGGRAITGTSPALIHHQQLSRNGPSSPTRRGLDPLSGPNIKTLPILLQSILIQRHSK